MVWRSEGGARETELNQHPRLQSKAVIYNKLKNVKQQLSAFCVISSLFEPDHNWIFFFFLLQRNLNAIIKYMRYTT